MSCPSRQAIVFSPRFDWRLAPDAVTRIRHTLYFRRLGTGGHRT
jgi:hypothetical protein